MPIRLFGLCFCVVMVGCQPPVEPATVTVTPKVPVAAPSPSPLAPTAKAGQTRVANQENPSRLYQLKDLKQTPVTVGTHKFPLWVMDTDSKRQEGMMFLVDKEVKPNEGMIFLFKDPQPNDGARGFWMRNCSLGLDIIYVSASKKVLNIGDGVPYNEKPVVPAGAFQYVVELKRGMGRKMGIKPGDAVQWDKNVVSQD